MSNKWVNGKMTLVPENQYFEMRIGEEQRYELRDAVSQKRQESPFIISKSGDEMYVDQNDSAFVSFLARIQMFIDKVPQLIKNKYGSGDTKMQFILTSRGLEIFHQNRKFMCRDGMVEQNRAQQVICGNHEVPNYIDARYTCFYLRSPYDGPNS